MISAALFLVFGLNAHAGSFGCTDWQKTDGVSCMVFETDGSAWTRSCAGAPEELQCRREPGNHPSTRPCLAEKLCFDADPNTLETDCTDWVRLHSVACASNEKPVAWRRVCQFHGVYTKACTKSGQSYPTDEDLID